MSTSHETVGRAMLELVIWHQCDSHLRTFSVCSLPDSRMRPIRPLYSVLLTEREAATPRARLSVTERVTDFWQLADAIRKALKRWEDGQFDSAPPQGDQSVASQSP